MLLLLSNYKMKSVPVVDLGEAKIDNIVTQSSVIHMLAECAGLQWFESWGTKKLSEIGLPLMTRDHVVKVHHSFSLKFLYEDSGLLAFMLISCSGHYIAFNNAWDESFCCVCIYVDY
jgi:hypothetical protein